MKSFLIVLLGLWSGSLMAQDYFQQEVNYVIDVKLNDVTHELTANETIEYTNNSPDELPFIWMHLWPNAYEDYTSALGQQMLRTGDLSLFYSDSIDRGYIDQLDFQVNGTAVKWEFHPEHRDIAKLILNQPLKSGERITITTPFHVKIPDGKFSRLGHVGQSYQITQWYPKPAVYDRNGWHEMPYLTQGEFYSEYGSFDVSITLPKNYVLGATGDMVDGEEELEWLEDKVEATEAIKEFNRQDMDFPESSKTMKTLRFKQSNVHDFAWFCDKRYHVLKGEVELPHSKRTVTSWAMFTNREAHLWKRSIEYLNDATYYYSLWTGDYPYNHVTAVDGTISAGGGMEYPNITVIGGAGNALGLETVIMHEVGHNWFYGILGTNERDHPWMDEGLNSYTENRYLETKYPKDEDQDILPGIAARFLGQHLNHKDVFQIGYLFNARRGYDQPIELHSDHYTSVNYGAIVYGKTALVFDYLKGYLGEGKFDQCMRAYFEKWKFKHPQPKDLQNTFEEVSGKKLDWFFGDLINTNKTIDYKIMKAKDGVITVKNVGGIAAPYNITALKDGEIVATKWVEGHDGTGTVNFAQGDYDLYRIDGLDELPEFNRRNNNLKTSGILRKVEPIKTKFLGGIERQDQTTIYWTPIVGWNEVNKWMLGAAFYNSIVPQKKFDYVLAPMYSFTSQSLTGYANVGYNIYPRQSNIFQQVRFEAAAATFNRFYRDENSQIVFQKLSPSITFNFKPKELNQSHRHQFIVRSHIVEEWQKGDIRINNEFPADDSQTNIFVDAIYNYTNNRPFDRIAAQAKVRWHDLFTTIEGQLNYRFNYNKRGRGVSIRLWGGYFLQQFTGEPIEGLRYRWFLSGQSGPTDYTYEGIFMDRSGTTGVLGQQFIDNHGGFKVPTGNGTNGNWMSTANIKFELPFEKFPVGIFSDFGVFPSRTFNSNTGGFEEQVSGLYDAGVYVWLLRGDLEVYFPLFYSDEIQSEFDFQNIDFAESIRFIFHLQNRNPFKAVRNFTP